MQDPLSKPSQAPGPLSTAVGTTDVDPSGLNSEGESSQPEEGQKSPQADGAPNAGAVDRAIAEIEHIVPLEPEKRRDVRRVVAGVVQQVRIEGPLPSPWILKQYGEIVPGSDKQIVAEFVADSQHARQITTDALSHQAADNKRQHWMAFTIIGLGYVMSLIFALLDKDGLAALVLGTTIVGTVVAFLQNRKQAEKPDPSEDEE